ncbi:MAG TPA: hypothetical protein DHW82_09770 [Spirochaetia bacterium]|nr:MAG: hypothetical protein A2Y41_10260 [Spirochaetes bacterium GWB1_36_13]HCL57279.1 hypothetical protein [Spirochaetia bacterium]
MKILGLNNMSVNEMNHELEKGARFVVFEFCISVLIMTFRRSSDIYFIRNGENTFLKSLQYTLLTFLMGWWGVPWGPIYSIGSLVTNFKGGKDITREVIKGLNSDSE